MVTCVLGNFVIEIETSCLLIFAESGSEISEGTHFSLESLSLSPHLTELPYAVLDRACEHFNQTLFRDGGHKLGSGGFGEVFHCKLEMGGTEKEVAVKALLTKVCMMS